MANRSKVERASRSADLVALELADLTFEPEGLRVQIRRFKTDQEGQGHEIVIPHGAQLLPVQCWMQAARITEGKLFRSIDRHGRISGALTAQSVALIVKEHAEAASLDPKDFAGHSLRAGFLTSAAEAGADVLRMMEVSRHKRLETVQGYIRRGNLFQGTRGDGVF